MGRQPAPHTLADRLDAEAIILSQDGDDDTDATAGMLATAADQLRDYHRHLDALLADQGCDETGQYATAAARAAEAFLEQLDR